MSMSIHQVDHYGIPVIEKIRCIMTKHAENGRTVDKGLFDAIGMFRVMLLRQSYFRMAARLHGERSFVVTE